MSASTSVSVSLDFKIITKAKILDSVSNDSCVSGAFYLFSYFFILNVESFPLICLIPKIPNKPDKQGKIFQACHMT